MNWWRWQLWHFGWSTNYRGDFKDINGDFWINLVFGLYVSVKFFQTPFMKALRGFQLLRNTNVKKSIVLFGYHHPDSITWLWNSWLYWDFSATRWKFDLCPTNAGWRFILATPLFQWKLEKQLEIFKEEVPLLLDKARKARRKKFVRKSWGKNYYQEKAKKEVVMSEIDKLIAGEKLKFDQETGANVVDMKSRTRH
jgi:hypothetical protein